jgi:primosomal protein N' (replication factor Y)
LEQERDLRQALNYPPFGRLTRLRFEHPSAAQALAQATQVAGVFKNLTVGGLECLGPSPAAIERLKGKYRFDLLLRSTQISVLQSAIFRAREYGFQHKISFLVDVDPMSLG